jgi:sec-independent protein translocase protein TatA
MLGTPELIVIVVLALLIFGPSQLPKLGRSAGSTIREFRKAGDELKSLHKDGFKDGFDDE